MRCETETCEAVPTCAVIDVETRNVSYHCEDCASALDDERDGLELVGIGAHWVADELNLDPVTIEEVRAQLIRERGAASYADTLEHLLRT